MSRSPMKNIGLIGVRDHKGALYENNTYVLRTFEAHLAKQGYDLNNISLITGGGGGVETMLVNWCEAKGIPCRKIPPNIQDHGTKKAFTIRNNLVVSQSEELVVFWDGCVDIIMESIISAMHQQKCAFVFPVI